MKLIDLMADSIVIIIYHCQFIFFSCGMWTMASVFARGVHIRVGRRSLFRCTLRWQMQTTQQQVRNKIG